MVLCGRREDYLAGMLLLCRGGDPAVDCHWRDGVGLKGKTTGQARRGSTGSLGCKAGERGRPRLLVEVRGGCSAGLEEACARRKGEAVGVGGWIW